MIRVQGDPIERPSVTKVSSRGVTKPSKRTAGRPRVHVSGAEKQKAYRARQKAKT